jgi:hypothetical protein
VVAVIGFGHTSPAMYQGSRLHLRVNRLAAADLAAVLSKAADNRRQAPLIRDVPLLLPDGRELTVIIQLMDAGHRRDARGNVVDSDGRSWADISGDFTLHVAARNVIDSASAPYPGRLTREQAIELDERRIRAKLDRVLPAIAGDDWLLAQREEVFRRAKAIADATRSKRIASAGHGSGGRRGSSGWSR